MGNERNVAMKTLYTDIDLTVLDFNLVFEDFLREECSLDIPFGILTGHSHLPNAIPEISNEDTFEFIHKFFVDDRFENLPALPYTKEAFNSLHDRGWEFVGISACPEYVGASRRKTNLEMELGVPFREVILSGIHDCKGKHLSKFDPTVWVEDNTAHADMGVKLGYRTYLIDHLHNRNNTTLATRVTDWRQIVEELCSET
jgi:hypothetical protein